MPAQREYRQVQAEYRLSTTKAGEVVADVVNYNVVDDYGTRFSPGVFDESIAQRMPRMVWGHDWLDPIGLWQDADSNTKRLRLKGQLDLAMIGDSDIPAVPSAQRAYAQLQSGTIDQWSVGFMRQADAPAGKNLPGITDITRGILDEASAVLTGAVPGTKTISIRSRKSGLILPNKLKRGRLLVPADMVQALMLDFESGRIDLADALMRLKQLAVDEEALEDDDDHEPDGGDVDPSGDHEPSDGQTDPSADPPNPQPDDQPQPEPPSEPAPEPIPDDVLATLASLGLEIGDGAFAGSSGS